MKVPHREIACILARKFLFSDNTITQILKGLLNCYIRSQIKLLFSFLGFFFLLLNEHLLQESSRRILVLYSRRIDPVQQQYGLPLPKFQFYDGVIDVEGRTTATNISENTVRKLRFKLELHQFSAWLVGILYLYFTCMETLVSVNFSFEVCAVEMFYVLRYWFEFFR